LQCESHTAVKLRLTLMNLPIHPKNLGPTNSLNMDSDNCHRNVTISWLLSRSYPVKNEPDSYYNLITILLIELQLYFYP